MEPSDLARHAGQWLRVPGPDSDVVLSTRIRLARNVEGYEFPGRISSDTRRELETQLRSWIESSALADAVQYCNLLGVDDLTRQVLAERHLVSRELVNGEGDRGVSFAASEFVSIMTNEEDHVRIQVIRSGQSLDEAMRHAVEVDRKLEGQIPYAWSKQYGYLTTCPTNVGTGLRISVMMHIPALVLMEQMDKVHQAASKVGLTVRGFYGEGTKAIGDVIQISNQQTLGRSEVNILETLGNIVPKIVEYERGVRTHLVNEKRMVLEDRVWRSMGTLRYARKLSSEETLNLLSAVRLGVNLQLLPNLSVGEVNELFVTTQPAHLQAQEGKRLEPEERDVARATLLREWFRPESN
ncbi:MAG: protein arginine kinase [Planctomycetes bacterium]|nr:protein arginine kinase [Planctomycetota bacterium]